MSDKKNIDRLFQEKFKDFEVAPSDSVWEGIEGRLHKKKKRRVISIWRTVGGAAAALLLMFAVGNTLFNGDVDLPKVVDTETPSTIKPVKINETNSLKGNKGSTVASERTSKTITPNSTSETNVVNRDKAVTNTSNSKAKNYKNTVASRNAPATKQDFKPTYSDSNKSAKGKQTNFNPVASSTSNSKTDKITKDLNVKSKSEIDALLNNKSRTTVAGVKTKNEKLEDKTETSEIEESKTKEDKTIEEAIAEANPITEKEEELSKWSISPNVAPVYFSSLGEGSSIDAQFNNNNTVSDVTMSYGIKGSYAINKRLKINTGVNRVNFNNSTTNVIALSTNDFVSRNTTPNIQNITLSNTTNAQPTAIISTANFLRSSLPEAINTLPDGNLEQRFGFIEIPLELQYRVIDKKLGVNLIGGFSTFFLNENEIFTDFGGTTTRIGKANNLNNTSYSANFGIGLDYSISKQININLEPKFKYQINTFNNTSGDFQSFFIGVYTGLSFKF